MMMIKTSSSERTFTNRVYLLLLLLLDDVGAIYLINCALLALLKGRALPLPLDCIAVPAYCAFKKELYGSA